MEDKKAYQVTQFGNKATRRDYSKVSYELELPDLVEIQTSSYEWFLNQGMREVFNDIFPISNKDKTHGETVVLRFIDCHLEEPKYSENECKYREINYAAPLKGTIELEVIKPSTGEVISKREEVYFGDFPLMTPSGTFIINGAERVIVSQIIRSPGAYFKVHLNEKTGKEIFQSELIPSRGTWLEFDKVENKNVLNVSVDRKRKILSTVLFKAIGLSLNLSNEKDGFETEGIRQFLETMGMQVHSEFVVESEQRELLNKYLLLYTSIFGPYETLVETLNTDKISDREVALREIYSNQRSDEVATLSGAITLMNAKFFDHKKYELGKAGRYKLSKKLGILERLEGHVLGQDIVDVSGHVVMKKGQRITRDERSILQTVFGTGILTQAYPMINEFSYPKTVSVLTSFNTGLVNRVLASDVEGKKFFLEQGTVLTQKEVDLLAKEFDSVLIYDGIIAKPITVHSANVSNVLHYGRELFTIGRVTTTDGKDITVEDELVVNRYYPEDKNNYMTSEAEEAIIQKAQKEKLVVYLIGAACQTVLLEENGQMVKVIGADPFNTNSTITISDMYAMLSYQLNMFDGIGNVDDIDMLGNRRIRTVGELIQNQFRLGLSRVEKTVRDKISVTEIHDITPKKVTNIRPLTAAIKEFFASSQLSQFMDQQNPLAELTNKRRISALGPGGLTRERAGFEVRDVHNSHYGRICPIETPEGPNIGLISNLTTYARVNEYGFIETPYRVVDKKTHRVTDNIVYLTADSENDYVIAQANEVKDDVLINDRVVARIAGETVMADRDSVELVDVSPKQIVSVATACIPFLENDDCTRALMGANMQRQAVPLLNPNSPYVGTGIEHVIARDSGTGCVSTVEGMVSYVDANKIVVNTGEKEVVYELTKFKKSNAGTCLNQKPIVQVGEKVKRGDILADGPSMQNGELALGQNVTIAFMTWNGYNYEDAIIMSERMLKEDVYTSIHIEAYDIECRNTSLGAEEITRDIPHVSEHACRNLDSRGIVRVGAEVKEGDILVGKVTPKGQTSATPEEKLLFAIFGEKSREVRDSSLKVPHGGAGIVQSVKVFKRSEGYDMPPGVSEMVKVYIVQKRKISEGDKMAGRHGNKGVISKILPVEDMPYMADGTPIDIMLNPFGVPSRMNIGQVLEIHLGMAAKNLGVKFATPVFDGISNAELTNIMKEGNVSPDGKVVLRDGRTGEEYDERISVGVMYMIKLAHMVDDKLHARATGPYSLVTQQPLGGKAQNGGQRFGEMEVWALEAYGAAHTLQEILTIKSDDIAGRTRTYAAIIKGEKIPEPGIPEAYRVLQHELQSLAIDVRILDENGREINTEDDTVEEKTDEQMAFDRMQQDVEGLTVFDEDENELAEVVAGVEEELD